MLSGFIKYAVRIQYMLCGFKLCCLDLYLSMHAILEFGIYFCLDWLHNEDCTLPDFVGCWFGPNSYNAKAALCGYQASWRLGETLSLLWATSLEALSRPLQDLLGAQWPSLSPPLSHKVTLLGRINASGIRIKQKKLREHLSLPFSRNKYLELLFTC